MNSLAAPAASAVPTARPLSLWRDIVCPKEHGSWSLAFEPLALGLLVAPSAAGASLAAACGGAFFARRPLRAWFLERRPERRAAAGRALAACAATAATAFAVAIALGGSDWLVWLIPAALAGACFAFFDARGEGREELAELAGATAFALTPIALAAAAGLPVSSALALGLVMVARSAPSVAAVRAFLRAAKTGVRRDGIALVTAASAVALAVVLVLRGTAPAFALIATALLAARTVILLVAPRPACRARTLGMIEAALGVAFVIGLAATWPA